MSTTDTRERLVDSALELFWFSGYETTSLADVCHRAEANPGSLYYFFPAKEALLEAALDRLHDSIDEGLLGPAWEGVDGPIEKIFALLDAYRRNLVDTDFRYGCPIGSISLELRELPEGVRTRLADNFRAWTDAVRSCLEEAKESFPPDTDLDALATFVLTTMEGGVMLARAERDVRPFDRGVGCLREYLSCLMDNQGDAVA